MRRKRIFLVLSTLLFAAACSGDDEPGIRPSDSMDASVDRRSESGSLPNSGGASGSSGTGTSGGGQSGAGGGGSNAGGGGSAEGVVDSSMAMDTGADAAGGGTVDAGSDTAPAADASDAGATGADADARADAGVDVAPAADANDASTSVTDAADAGSSSPDAADASTSNSDAPDAVTTTDAGADAGTTIDDAADAAPPSDDAAETSNGNDAGSDANSTGPNLCDKSHWPFWITTNFQVANNPVYQSVDGNGTTQYQSGRAQDGTEYVQIDFHGSVTLDGLTLDYAAGQGDYPRGYKVYVSDSSTPPELDVVATGTPTAPTPVAPNLVIPFTSAKTGRYLRLAQTGVSGGPWWSIYELSLNSCVVAQGEAGFPVWDGGTADVTNRANWAITIFNALPSAANIIDSNVPSEWQSQRAPLDGMWLEVDLGAVGDLHGIVLTHKPGDGPVQVKVLVSTNGIDFTEVVAPTNGADAMDLPFNATARYVRVVHVGTRQGNWWSIRDFSLKP